MIRSLAVVVVSVLLAGALLLLLGCPQKSEKTSVQPRPAPAGKETGPTSEELQGSIAITGSDTMVHLATAWAEAFMKLNPKVAVAVNGGGSGVGISALIDGTIDIATASREMKPDEKKTAAAKGVNPVEHTVARDGIAVVVHPENPVNELTLEQLKKIFTGATTNWKAVGGPDQQIGILSRESSSGTYEFFREHVLNKEDYSTKARLMPATSAIIEAVKQEKGAIGYVGLGYAREASGAVKVLKVKVDENAPAIAPSDETVKSGEYGIARALYLYTNGQPEGVIKAFIDFCISDRGQKIVEEQGYIRVD